MGEFMRFARYVFFGATLWLIPGMIFSFITISPGASESIKLYLMYSLILNYFFGALFGVCIYLAMLIGGLLESGCIIFIFPLIVGASFGFISTNYLLPYLAHYLNFIVHDSVMRLLLGTFSGVICIPIIIKLSSSFKSRYE